MTLDTYVSDMRPGQYFDILLNGEKAVILAIMEYGQMSIYIVHNTCCLYGCSAGRNYWRTHREEGMPEFERSWYKSVEVNGTIGEMLKDIHADVELI